MLNTTYACVHMEFYTGSIVFRIMGEKNSSTWSAGQWIVSSGHSSLSNRVSHFSEMNFRRQALNVKLATEVLCRLQTPHCQTLWVKQASAVFALEVMGERACNCHFQLSNPLATVHYC